MKPHRIIILLSVTFLLINHISVAGDNAPHEISGFRLGASIDDYEYISYRNYMKDVIVEEIGGFRKGEISYGLCENPGEIIRIKMKYKDPSRQFYEELFERYKKKFGKPDEFTGDAFGIVIEWKWRFVDKDNNNITVSLQHNLKNIDENVGNMVKLSLPDKIEAERQCFNRLCETKQQACPVNLQDESWENMLPH